MKKNWSVLYLDMYGDPLVTIHIYQKMTYKGAVEFADANWPMDREVIDFRIEEDVI